MGQRPDYHSMLKRTFRIIFGISLLFALGSATMLSAEDAPTTYPTANFSGRLQLDSSWTVHDANRSPRLEDQADIRRLRLQAKGELLPDLKYTLQAETKPERPELLDALVDYRGIEHLRLRAGHMHEYNGLEALTSNRSLIMMERAEAVTTFRPRRSLGIGVEPHGDAWRLQLGLFGDDINAATPDNGGVSLEARGYVLPVDLEERVFFLGATARTRTQLSGNRVRFAARGASAFPEATLIDTGWIQNVDSYDTYSAEFFAQYAPWSLTGEYHWNDISRTGQPDARHEGGYLTASWFLTGEHRHFSSTRGRLTHPLPHNPFSLSSFSGTGAWELAVRHQFLDLDDANIRGGTLQATTAGLNWYPTDDLRIMLNYTRNRLNRSARIPQAEPHYLALRAQWDF